MKQLYFVFLVFLFVPTLVLGQSIRLQSDKEALNIVLIQLRDEYNLHLSFNDEQLAKYTVSVSGQFETADEALDHILKGIPFVYEKNNGGYIIFRKESVLAIPKKHTFRLRVTDASSTESLPYTHVLVNQKGYITDEFGVLPFQSFTDSVFRLSISFLGYHRLDTVVFSGKKYNVQLQPASVGLAEVLITESPIAYAPQVGSAAGLTRINHRIAKFLPGNGDNSVFHLLRLQPGVLAAGEQSKDMMIWGSDEGQSQVNYDGITIFGLKNYSDNISAVNPYMAKDIRIYKGGYGATIGQRVGGVVNITGVEGNTQRAGISLNVNNMTMNAKAEAPITNRLRVVAAFRKTYYEVYQPGDLTLTDRNMSASDNNNNNVALTPDYNFLDGNLKISGSTTSGNTFQISTFAGKDKFEYQLSEDRPSSTVENYFAEHHLQYGASALYNKLWGNKGNSKFRVAYSSLESKRTDEQTSVLTKQNHNLHKKDEVVQNDVSELKINLHNQFQWNPQHKLEFGVGLVQNETLLQEDTFAINRILQQDTGRQFYGFLQDQFNVGSKLYLTLGLRADYSVNMKKTYFQPRVSMRYLPSKNLQLNAAWGYYNQFISLSTIQDQYQNIRYQWHVCLPKKSQVLFSEHYVVGAAYNKGGFTLSLEGFWKETKGISKYIQKPESRNVFHGDGRSMGVDFFLKQEYKGHSFWLSYTLSQAQEWFPFFSDANYLPALHDQRHEIKLATLVQLKPFYISANYVYGSGFLQRAYLTDPNVERYPYHRFDLAANYRFVYKNIEMETGLSVLNLFDYENIKYANAIRIPYAKNQFVNIHSEAVPFTPSIFFNVSF